MRSLAGGVQREGRRVSASCRDAFRYAKRVTRALRGRDTLQSRQIRCEREWLGADGARWCIWPGGLGRDSVVYSFGIGDDISFDLDLIRRFNLTVHAFDPTPRSAAWLAARDIPSEFIAHAIGVAAFDGIAAFSPPEDPQHVSFSVLRRSVGASVEGPVRRLSTIAAELGHAEIDLLKMDVEGGEYDVIVDMLECEVPVRQLLVEFHHRWREVGIGKTREAVAMLNTRGFRVFDVAPSGEEYSFLRLDYSGCRS